MAGPRKILFFGPPDCGKTLFVEAIAGEAQKADQAWTCVEINSAGILKGDAYANVEKAFEGIPTFGINQIIIDDLGVFIHDLETDPKALRLMLSSMRRLRNVLVTAVTRLPVRLSPDVLEVFDMFVPMLYPSKEDRSDILRKYCSQYRTLDEATDALLNQLSGMSAWFSGLELAKLIIDTFATTRNPTKQEDFLPNLNNLAASFNIEERRKDLEEYLEFTLGNTKIPFEFQEEARQLGIELGLMSGSFLVKSAEILRFLGHVEKVKTAEYRIVGNYVRFKEDTRTALSNAVSRVKRIFADESLWSNWNNFLVHGPPGSGKTYFVEQLTKELPHDIRFRELNLAKIPNDAVLREKIGDWRSCLSSGRKLLLFIDEVESRQSENWPFPALLPVVEWNKNEGKPFVCFLSGSKGRNLPEFISLLTGLNKGSDLLSRIPHENRIVIPPLSYEDKIIITICLSQEKALHQKKPIAKIEKTVLAVVSLRPDIADARQIEGLVSAAVQRVPLGEDVLGYDHLFNPFDKAKYELLRNYPDLFGALAGKYVTIDGG